MQDKAFFHLDASPSAASSGPLEGKGIVIQPNMSVRGWPTEAGSVALENFAALEDAAVVESLRSAGAGLVGSSRMAELGLGLAGDTTAQALADGKCHAALVTDTLGEARLAASAAGVVGFKPSYGIVSRFGLIGLVPSMECYGVVAEDLDDVARVMAAIAGPDERDPSMRQDGLPDFSKGSAEDGGERVAGVMKECIDGLGPDEKKAFQSAVSRIEAAGARVQEVALSGFDLFRVVHNVVGSTEASSAAGKYDSVRYGHRADGTENWNEMYLRSRAESFGPLVKSYLFQGAYFQFENYAAFENACRLRRRLVEAVEGLFGTVDLLVCPTRRIGQDPYAATAIDAVYDAFALSLPANVTGCPAVSLPGFVTDGTTDLGLQIVAAPLADVGLLDFAARLMG